MRQHDLLAVAQVLFPRARVPVVSEVFLKPDLKVEGLHIVPSAFQKTQSKAAVHTSTQQDSNIERSTHRLAAAVHTQSWACMGVESWLLGEACVPLTHPCKICRSSGSCDGCFKVSSEAQSTKLLSSVRSEVRSVKVAALTSTFDALRLLFLLADLTAKEGAQNVRQTGNWPATTRVRVCMQTMSGETQSYHLPLSILEQTDPAQPLTPCDTASQYQQQVTAATATALTCTGMNYKSQPLVNSLHLTSCLVHDACWTLDLRSPRFAHTINDLGSSFAPKAFATKEMIARLPDSAAR